MILWSRMIILDIFHEEVIIPIGFAKALFNLLKGGLAIGQGVEVVQALEGSTVDAGRHLFLSGMLAAPPEQQSLLECQGKTRIADRLAERETRHEAVDILREQVRCFEVFESQTIPTIGEEQTSEHGRQVAVAIEIVLLHDAGAQTPVLGMASDLLVIGKQLHRLVRPSAIEQRVAEGAEVLASHGIVAHDEVGLGQPLVATSALLVVGDGFLCFENETLRRIDHAKLIVGFGCSERRNGVADKFGQQSFDTILDIAEHVVGHQSLHAEGKIEGGNHEGIVGHLVVGGLQDAVPLLVARHVVVGHDLLGARVHLDTDTQSNNHKGYQCAHNGANPSLFRLVPTFHEKMQHGEHSHRTCRQP